MAIFTQDTQTIDSAVAATQILEQLQRLIAEHIMPELPMDQINPDEAILEDGLGLDSIKIVELIVLIEKNFGFTFTEDELSIETFASLRALANFVAERQGRQTG